VEGSDGTPKTAFRVCNCFRSRLSGGTLFYSKGYCGRARHGAGCGAEHGTSRGSEEKRVRIHLQAQSNIQSDTYQVQNIKGNKEKPKRGKRA